MGIRSRLTHFHSKKSFKNFNSFIKTSHLVLNGVLEMSFFLFMTSKIGELEQLSRSSQLLPIFMQFLTLPRPNLFTANSQIPPSTTLPVHSPIPESIALNWRSLQLSSTAKQPHRLDTSSDLAIFQL